MDLISHIAILLLDAISKSVVFKVRKRTNYIDIHVC